MRLVIILAPLLLLAQSPDYQELRKVQAHLAVDDPHSALQEAKRLYELYPNSKEAATMLIEAFAAKGEEAEALQAWHALSLRFPDLIFERQLLEEIAWGSLKRGCNSTQYGVRIAALVGVYLTQDTRAVPVLLRMMRDSNAVVRSIAVQLASAYRDMPLKAEILRLIKDEKIWMVRLELIKTAGLLHMEEVAPQLKQWVQSEKTTYEERQLAIQALLQIYDEIGFEQWERFATSNRAGLRHLACRIAEYFGMDAAAPTVARLILDPHPDVRIAAINAWGLTYYKTRSLTEALPHLKSALDDATPDVAITAAWAMAVMGEPEGGVRLQKWLTDPTPEYRRMAAAAVAATGPRCKEIAAQMLSETQDRYVKANLALGLLGQRYEIAKASDILFEMLETEKRMWMWDNRANPLFQTLAPSQVRHVDHIPNYPEAIDQMTRLNLVSILAYVEDPRAETA
ncbi:MAG: hypothetical protein RL235_527, partial [Chlamydiota bacterium]